MFITVSVSCFGQDINPYTKEPYYDKYYPENKTIRSNRIKYIIDSSEFILPGKFNIKLYDTLGRLIGDINRSAHSFETPFVYTKIGDTTFRLKYNAGKTVLLCYERFVHNKKGQIISYLDCCNYYFKSDSYYVGYVEFYYDEKNMLKTKLSYFNEEYPGKVSDKTKIKPTDLQLNDVVYYSHKTLKNGNKLIIGKHALGKPDWRAIDSTIYDNQNRVIRFNSFAKVGSTGEWVFYNLNNITDYEYTGSTLTITNYSTYCRVPLINNKCFDPLQTEKDVSIIIYNHDKTKKAQYGFYTNGEKYVKDKYSYAYY
ncbi:MAG: hypothetical protein JNM88_20370 [Chitinophagaceae bacterium]|nr:hypothetical protein [Chitinophagaceae bacterium]